MSFKSLISAALLLVVTFLLLAKGRADLPIFPRPEGDIPAMLQTHGVHSATLVSPGSCSIKKPLACSDTDDDWTSHPTYGAFIHIFLFTSVGTHVFAEQVNALSSPSSTPRFCLRRHTLLRPPSLG